MIKAVQMEVLWGELDQTNEFTAASLVEKHHDPVLTGLLSAQDSLTQK